MLVSLLGHLSKTFVSQPAQEVLFIKVGKLRVDFYTADGLKLDVQQKAKSQVRQGFDQFWESPRFTRPEYTPISSNTSKAASSKRVTPSSSSLAVMASKSSKKLK
jgi:hypothetical protein